MKEKFVPQLLDSETGKIKPIPPERLAEIERGEKESGKKEKSRTIRLKRDATFVDLFGAEDRIAEKVRESGDEDENVDDPTYLVAELWDNFDKALASEVLDLRIKLEALRLKRLEEYTDEEKRLMSLNVLEYFKEKGYSVKDVETFLPIKFKKEKRPKQP